MRCMFGLNCVDPNFILFEETFAFPVGNLNTMRHKEGISIRCACISNKKCMLEMLNAEMVDFFLLVFSHHTFSVSMSDKNNLKTI